MKMRNMVLMGAIGRSFLQRNVDSATVFSNSVRRAGAVDPRVMHPVWWNQNAYSYYRYPGQYGAYYAPVNFQAAGKNELIGQIEAKKNMIPNYHQQITVQGTRMPADASTVIVDVTLNEYGMAYANPYYYGGAYASKIQHSTGNCQMHLRKDDGIVHLTRMTCSTLITG